MAVVVAVDTFCLFVVLFVCFSVANVSNFSAVDAQLPLTVNITEDGDYTVSRNGTVWLQSAPTFFIIDSVTYSAADSSLTFLGWNTTSDLGYFVDRLYYYANGTNIVASVHRYNAGFLGFTVVMMTMMVMAIMMMVMMSYADRYNGKNTDHDDDDDDNPEL